MKLSKYLVFAVGWFLLVTALHCIPGTELPVVSWSSKILLDKWIHIFLFLGLVWIWCKAYKKSVVFKLRRIFVTITVLSIIYGIIMEIAQHYLVPFRSFDVGDIIADSIGAVTGYFLSVKRLK